MYRCVFAAVAAACLAAPVAAQYAQRNFPQSALRGTLQVANPPGVLLNGKPAQLAPGARIRGANNMLELSGALVGQPARPVHYTLEFSGLIKDVWVLTPAEVQKKPWPSTPQEAQNWHFDALAQTWTQP